MTTTKAYMRVSTSAQLEGQGIAQQRNDIIAYAVQQNLKIDEWVTEDESGTTGNREQIQRLLSEAQAGTLKILVLDRMDRLGRDVLVCESLFRAFRDAGCDLRFVAQFFESSPSGDMIRVIFAAVAQHQRAEWLDRMKTCRHTSACAKGTYIGGVTPYGYKHGSNAVLEIHPQEAEMVRHCFELSKQGASLRTIVRDLNERGYKTRNGTNFTHTHVRRILAAETKYRAIECFNKNVTLREGVLPAHPALF